MAGKFRPNSHRIKGDIIEIDVTRRDGSVAHTAIIDTEDYDKIKDYRWGFTERPDRRWGPYILRHGRGQEKKTIYLHRFLMEPIPEGFWVDHKDGNTLDNRKGSLVICKPEENVWNQRNQRGIFSVKGHYRAQISREFDTYEKALEQRTIWEDGRI